MPEPSRRLEQAMSSLTIGAVKDLQRREAELAADGLQEFEEQFQIAIAGRAEEFAQWQEAEVKFAIVFVDGTGQRDSELIVPQFTYGSQIYTPTPVGVAANVMRWHQNNRGEIRGATLAIGVLATDVATKFRGSLHATFQGWGQPANTFEDLS